MNAEKREQVQALSATGWGPLPIANAARIPSQEIRRHLSSAEGRAAVRKNRDRVLTKLASSILDASEAAMRELKNILQDGDTSERLKAAKIILDAATLIVTASKSEHSGAEDDEGTPPGGSMITIDISALSEETRHILIRETATAR